ncbi:MAG: hypothetical protein KC535_00745 [Nanoarchaeota archaeon]|nr:hypothetical protein [Nanoarchaeota archaeon]
MEETQNNTVVGASQETFEQKVIRNIREGAFAVYKTPEVVGEKTMVANIEWEDPEQVDKFFAFAKSFGAKVIYVAESEDEDESGQSRTGIAQIGFLYNGIMHHINLAEEDEDDEDDEEYEEDESEDEYEEDEQEEDEDEPGSPQPQAPAQPMGQQAPQGQYPSQQQPAGNQQPSQWPRPQF